ncbi:MAG: AAA family ATPase [Dehalococcoidia bacterium]|nr:AAA family ATPase [Dehalococcoidia bacterium]
MNRRQAGRKTNPELRWPLSSGKTSPFVGRDDELRRLQNALTLAAQGQGGTIILTGQPGIGKTRLALEALALAKEHGFEVLEGRAFPLEVGLSYSPILDAFSRVLGNLEATSLEALVSGLPDLGRLFSDLRLPPPSFSEGLGDPALEKTRLFHAVSRLLQRLALKAPVAFFIDDVHWADPATLELLHYLARGLSDQRVLLLATLSNDAMNSYRGLRGLVTSLQQAGLGEEVAVPPLGRDAVGKLVRGVLEGEVSENLVELLVARASGTPLYIKALIEALIDCGCLFHGPAEKDGWILDREGAPSLPPSVRRLILDRLERLPPTCRHVLELIAIIGDTTPHTILRSGSGLAEEALLDTLRHLQAAGLVAEGMDGLDVTYSITHPLIQEAACAALPEMVRRHAHVAAIEAIERFRPDDIIRLARHYLGAGPEANGDHALEALLSAGERAISLYANEEAARYYAAALTMVRNGGFTAGFAVPFSKGEPLLPWLLERLGEAWEQVGEGSAAIRVWNEALTKRERANDAVAAARLRRRLAQAEWDRCQFDVADAHLRAGLLALGDREPCQELADLLFTHCYILGRLGNVAGMADSAAELLVLAHRLGSPRAEAEANFVASISCLWRNDVANARAHALHALVVSERAQELVISCHAHVAVVLTGMRLGDHNLIRYHSERGLAVARRLGLPAMEVFLLLRLADANFMAGAWKESLQNGMEAVGLARRAGHPRDLANALAGRAMILALQGDLPAASACVSEVRTVFSRGSATDRHVFSLVEIAETALALDRRQVERALGIARGFIHQTDSSALAAGLTPPFMPMGLMLLAEAQVAAGEPEEAMETAAKLVGLGPTGTPYLSALASRAEGLSRQALGEHESAISCFARSHETFAALGMPFEAARSLLDQATTAIVVNPEGAATAARQSLSVFESLGAQRYIDRSRRLLQGLGISPPPIRWTRLGGVYLSARELEIALLVADGLTTPEIAVRLGLSPRTVASHLDHIYTRMGIGSRAALTRCVSEAGLLSLSTENT